MKHIWSPWRMTYIISNIKNTACVFCAARDQSDSESNLIIAKGSSSFVILNRYPYTSGHIMVVPNRHAARLDELDEGCRAEIIELSNRAILVIGAEYKAQGFNVGLNIGEAAGAGIAEHLHMHVVPRWGGDTNFMSSIGGARVLPETLQDTYQRLRKAWKEFSGNESA